MRAAADQYARQAVTRGDIRPSDLALVHMLVEAYEAGYTAARSKGPRLEQWLRDLERGREPAPDQIWCARRDAGLTQQQMADMLHVAKRTYRAWESAETPMDPNVFFAMRVLCWQATQRERREQRVAAASE